MISLNSILARRGVRQFIKFGLVGLSSFIIDAGVYFVATRYLGVFYVFAKSISFLVAVINSYIWNRRWTFRSENAQKAQEFVKFLVVAGIGFGLNVSIMFIAVSKMHLLDLYGLILATIIVTIWNFTINKLWVFKKSEPIIIE